MQRRWEGGGIGVPRHHVEGRGLVTQEVVADPVVPDEVVGAQRGEEPEQHAAVEGARLGGGPYRGAHDRGAPEHADHGGDAVVHLRDSEGGRADTVLSDRGQVAQHARSGETTGTDADHSDGLAGADLGRRCHGLFDSLDVGVQVPLALGAAWGCAS